MATYIEWERAKEIRDSVVSQNRSRRIRGIELLPVPEVPNLDKVPIAYSQDGTYQGRLESVEDCPNGCVVKWQNPKW